MSTPATIPFTAPRSSSQKWTPSDRDRVIFQWVKFDGHKQSWVAEQLNIDQSTVSRIVDRYERWIARGGPAHRGSPSHDERLRAQRWLTYERNEWILTSALRIAGEMEHALETSKSTVARPMSEYTKETEVRTEHKVIDRSGIACRFLRLAHRINMDQLQLVEQDPLPPLEPLTFDDVTCAEASPADAVLGEPPANNPELAVVTAEQEPPAAAVAEQAPSEPEPPLNHPPMPSVHKDETAPARSNGDSDPTCAENAAAEKSSAAAYRVAAAPPDRVAEPPSPAFTTPAEPTLHANTSPLAMVVCHPPTAPCTTDY